MGGKTKELFTFGFHKEHSIAEGYLKSAELVVRHGAAQGGFHPVDDLLVYPFMFSLRQAVELALKEMISAICTIKGRDPLELYEKNFSDHNLKRLLKVFQELSKEPALKARYIFTPEDERFIAKINTLDPNAASFRYCKTSSGQPIVHFLRQKIDVIETFNIARQILEKSRRYCYELVDTTKNVYSYSTEELKDAKKCIHDLEKVLKYFKNSQEWIKEDEGIDEDHSIDLDLLFTSLSRRNDACNELRSKIPDQMLINATKGYYFGRNGFFDRTLKDESCRRKLFEVDVRSIAKELDAAKAKLKEITKDRIEFCTIKSRSKKQNRNDK